MGVGDIFKRQVAELGYKEVPGCPCKAIRKRMNDNGPDWCLANLSSLTTDIAKGYAERGGMQRILSTFAKPVIRSLILSAVAEFQIDALG